ncbi:MAG: family 78 glycoside hydrolase catalytic domain [Anaerolineae bacterium]|nr:glycoside hydrolase family 78 protein [Anaerolineae bacterium]MDW8100769.1 family 78 glycoside hydrolase catalytic domain [Anaerolineae bacterium]
MTAATPAHEVNHPKATSIPVTPADFPEIRWRGHWIWVEPSAPPGRPFPDAGSTDQRAEVHGLFRKTFYLKQMPSRAPTRITADSRYILFVNGQEVSRGPIRSQPRRMYYDLFDLAPYLQPGKNVIAAHVKYYGTPKSYWMPAVANMTLGRTGVLVFEAYLDALSDDVPDGWLVSDATWKAIKSDAWTGIIEAESPIGGGIPVEAFDARRLPADWHALDFDDTAWGNAHLIPAMHVGGFARTQPPTDPYGPLYPRPITQLDGETRTPVAIRAEYLQGSIELSDVSPMKRVENSLTVPIVRSEQVVTFPSELSMSDGGAVRLIIDMGRIVSGFVQFEVKAPIGTVLDLSYAEEPITGPGDMLHMRAGTRYVARGSDDSFQTFDSNGFRYAYCLIHSASGPVTLQSFSVREHLYPWMGGASFECSDEELNRIFRAGIRTVQLNSHDAFLDCPTREQRAWVGDGVVHQMVHLATNLDWRLAWYYLTLANSPRSDGILPMSVAGDIEASGGITIPDWSLHWVHGVYNLYRFAGDRKKVKSFMPTVERILRWYEPYQNSQGLLKDVVEWNLVDWSSISTEDTSAVITALWARGLKEFAEMAEWLGERASQAWAEELYAKAKAGFEVFWDEHRGSYVDHIVNGIRQPEMSQLGGALAIVSELAPRERWSRIIEAITDPKRLVEATWIGGANDEEVRQKFEKQIRGIYEPDWDVENQIVLAQPFMQYVVHDAVALAGQADRLPQLYRRWLRFLVNGYDTIGECWSWGTHVHGWSCTPTRDMIFYTLGVTPAEPGYTVARIAPRLGDLAWAEGRVPTPHGLIHVRAEPGTVFVDSPVPVIVELPGQAPRSLPAGRHEVKA